MDLAAVRHNLGVLRASLARAKAPAPSIYAVVKADAYGHGALRVAGALEQAGVDGLAVSLVEEGIELRSVTELPILVMGGAYFGAHREVIEHRLVPIVFDLGDAEKLAAAAGSARVSIHVKIDTGMSRLGLLPSEVEKFFTALERFPALEVEGLCTHLACADLPDRDPTLEQLERFRQCLDAARAMGISPRFIHAGNSAAAVRFPESHFNAVRPGIALLGDAAAPGAELPGTQPVFRLTTQILTLRDLEPQTPVSYGGLWRAPKRSRIATLPIGYADGYPRRMFGQADVLVRGCRAPVVGAVSMDMIMIDVTAIEGAAPGDPVVLLGQQGSERISAGDWARWVGTVNYEIYCGISKRVPRIYRG